MTAPLMCVRPPGWVDGDATDAFAATRDWVLRAEALGFDGVLVGDRLLARAGGRRGVVHGASMLEATTLLAALAAVTSIAGTWQEALRTYTVGTVESVVEQIAAATAGIDRVDAYVLTPLGGDVAQLEALRAVAAGLRARASEGGT